MLLLFSCLIYQDGTAQRLEPVHLLEGTTVYDVLRDHNGVMWFGTNTGLVRYDGYEMVTFSTSDGLPGNEILRLHLTEDNRLWMLNFNGNPSFFQDGIIYTPQNTRWLEGAVSGEPHTSIFSENNTVFIASEYGEIKVIKNEEVYNFTPLGYFRPVFNLFKDGHILYMLDNSQTELYRYDLNTKVIIDTKTFNGVRSSRVGMIDGEPYVPSEKGIAALKPNTEPSEFNFQDRGIFDKIISFAHTDDRYFAVGTENGLFFLNRDTQSPATKILDDYFISSVFYDAEGNIWATTLGHGVFLFPAGFWQTFRVTTSEMDISRFMTAAILDDNIAIAGFSEQIYWWDSNRQRNRITMNLNPVFRAEINQLAYKDGLLCISTVDGVYIADASNENPLNAEFISVPVSSTKDIHIQNRDTLFIASIEGIHRLTRNDSGSFDNHYEYLGRSITVLKTQELGVVFGTSSGVYYIKDDEILLLMKELDGQQVTEITQTIDGSLFIGTNGSGLWKYNNGLTEWMFPENTRLKSVRDIAEADDGSVWIATSQGLFRLQDDMLELFDEGNFNSVVLKGDDILYTSTETGIFTKQERLILKPVELKLREYRFMADNQPVWSKDAYRFSHNTQTITVEARAAFYRKRNELEYHYTFDDSNDGWLISKLPELVFREQPPGNYTLRIKAVVPSEGLSSDPITIRYEIIPPVWQRMWFIIIGIGLIMGALLFGFDIRLNRVRRKEAEKLKQYAKMVELEQQAMSAMMNPHFVFNVLNSIRYYMGGETPEKAQEYLAQFARLIRLQLESSFNKHITLIHEIERLEHYVKLEALRLKYPLTFSICKGDLTEDDLEEIQVPSMLLQPFIENAIWHGIQPKKAKGCIEVKFRMADADFLKIVISDDGIGMDASKKQAANKEREHASLAMHLIRERLQLMSVQSGRQATINTESNSESGTTVTLKLPV